MAVRTQHWELLTREWGYLKKKTTSANENIAAVRPRTLPYGYRTGHVSGQKYDWHLFYHSFARSAPISGRERPFLR